MDRRDFLKYAGATAVGASILGCVSVQKRKRSHTNFVIIFTDDQGYADVGSYGAEGFTTPNLDQMGKNGYPGSRINRTTELELYDLKNDISERNNVIDQHRDVVRRLEKLAEKARLELGDSLTERKGQEIRPEGKL